ncbi:7397_t:CDS:2, partial [Paraglomus occultum]
NSALEEAVEKFIDSFVNMYITPRIQRPLWLNMSTFPRTKPTLATSFMTELNHLLNNFDTEPSWVPTVAPVLGTDDRNRKSLSYDPLWAQLSDLYGMIAASEPIMCRTIVYGAHANTVRRILFVLSYFIRCNEVFEDADLDGCDMDDPLNLFGTNKQSINTTEILSQNSDKSSPITSETSGSPSNSRRTSETGFPFGVSMDEFIDVPMPKSTRKRTIPNPDSPTDYHTDELYSRSYGRSLMAGYCEAYQPDFVLMGLPKLDFQDLLESDLRESVQ